MKQGAELGLERPNEPHGLGGLQASERLPRRSRRRLKPRLPILPAAVSALSHVERNADQRPLHLISQHRAPRSQHPNPRRNPTNELKNDSVDFERHLATPSVLVLTTRGPERPPPAHAGEVKARREATTA